MPHVLNEASEYCISPKQFKALIDLDCQYYICASKTNIIISAFSVLGDAEKEVVRLNALMQSCNDKRRYTLHERQF